MDIRNVRDRDEYVKQIFNNIAPKYEKINIIISWGFINHWRKKVVELSDFSCDDNIIELCAGTGKVTKILSKKVNKGKITAVDFCPQMLKKARNNLKSTKYPLIQFQLGNILDIHFPDNSFDGALVAFGLRNVSNIEKALKEMRRVVKPGGKVICLDLSKPQIPVFKELYYIYFNHLLPYIGKKIHGNIDPYKYFVQSLKEFLDQEELKNLFQDIGLKQVKYYQLTGGITAIHMGIK